MQSCVTIWQNNTPSLNEMGIPHNTNIQGLGMGPFKQHKNEKETKNKNLI